MSLIEPKTENVTKEGVEVRVGQVWRSLEHANRMGIERTVEVISLTGYGRARVRSNFGALSTISIRRMHKGRTGYELLSGGHNPTPAPATFQQRVRKWLLECFGQRIADDLVERNHRFFEEAGEYVQAHGMSREDAHKLVDYVWDRPVGEPKQELGGVLVTVAAHATAAGLDMTACGDAEITRVEAPEIMAKVKAKQAAKPKFGPLPQ